MLLTNSSRTIQVDAELTARRAAQPGFVGPSFATIAGAGPNGAVIHYRPQPGSCRTVDGETLLLLDSGGQYECGEEGTAGVEVGGRSRNGERMFRIGTRRCCCWTTVASMSAVKREELG